MRCTAFSRVCDLENTLVVNEKAPWSDVLTGVWIDIFPLDGAPDDEDDSILQLKKLKSLWIRCCYAREARSSFSSVKDVGDKIKLFLKVLIPNERVVSKFIKEASSIKWGQTRHFWNCSYLRYGMKEYQEISDYSSTIIVPFEDSLFYVCNGYDHLMRTKYGDYMQLPPESKQKSNHKYLSYYWKK